MACQERSFRRHSVVSVLAIAVLVFQAVVTAAMLPMPLGTNAAQASGRDGLNAGAFPGAVIICTSHGFMRVTFDSNGDPVEEPVSAGHCSVCEALAATAFALPAVDEGAPILFSFAGFAPLGGEFRFVSAIPGTRNNRGPPLRA